MASCTFSISLFSHKSRSWRFYQLVYMPTQFILYNYCIILCRIDTPSFIYLVSYCWTFGVLSVFYFFNGKMIILEHQLLGTFVYLFFMLDRFLEEELLGQSGCTFKILINMAKLPLQKLGLVYTPAHTVRMYFSSHFCQHWRFNLWLF